jgi:tetratricopeptide (TPR) repeat protein
VTSLGRNAEAIAAAERALAMVARLGDRRLEAEACCVLGNTKIRSNDSTSGRAVLERALILAQELDNPTLAAEACAYLANVCAWTGDLQRSIELSLRRAELARRTHDLFQLRHVYSWIGLLETLRGRWAEAGQSFAYYQGRFTEAEQEFRDAVALVRPTGSGALVWFLGPLGLALAELGRRDEALARLTELHALAGAPDERAGARRCAFAYLAVGYTRLGEQERAARCYLPLLPFKG